MIPIKELSLIEYWLRKKGEGEGQGHRIMAVCLVANKEQTIFSRGFALLSPFDRFDLKEGINRARKRAIKAFYTGISTEKIRSLIASNILSDALTNKHPKEMAKKDGLYPSEVVYKSNATAIPSVFEFRCLKRRLDT